MQQDNKPPAPSAEEKGKFFPLPRNKDFLILNLGLIVTALGVVLFKSPNNFAMGGTSGLSILLSSVFPRLNVGTMMLIINVLLILVGYLFLGKNFGGSTIYSSIMLSVYITLFEYLIPLSAPLTDDTLLELAWAVILPAVGSAMVFNVGSSTGGTDIIAMILTKRTSLEIGKTLFLSDILISVFAGMTFGVKTMLYCMLGTVSKSFITDGVTESLNIRKQFTIVTCKEKEVLGFIIKDLNRSASVYRAYGAFTQEEQDVIITVLTRRQAMLLRNYIRKIDPGAFITIVNSSETIGKGFREL